MNSISHCVRIFLLVLALTRTVPAQTDRLVEVRSPDVWSLEETVRDQIIAARSALAAAAKSPPATLSEEYGNLGGLYHVYSLFSAARDCYVNANRLAPKDFRWIYLLAKLDQQEGRFDDAIRRYRLSLSLRRDYVAAFVNLGNIFLELNRLDEARANFRATLEVNRNIAAAYYGLGQIALSQRNYAEAIADFEKTLELVPAANRVHYSLAMAYRGLGDAEKAKAHLAQQGTVGLRVFDPLLDGLRELIVGERVYLARGKVAFEARRYADAVTEFRKAVAEQPDSVTAHINLGAALTQVGDVTGAIEQFEEALRLDPAKVNAHYNLAVLLAGQNKHELAITHLRSVLKTDENDLNARFLLARELKNTGRLDEALAEYARMAYLLAASSKLELRNGARSLELAQDVYRASKAAQHAALVALALAELGRCNEAADWQRRAITAAEQQANTALFIKLRSALKLYETQPCRPTNETVLGDVLFEKNP
jgi:tetratricopeptide (TPR) repeat protein